MAPPHICMAVHICSRRASILQRWRLQPWHSVASAAKEAKGARIACKVSAAASAAADPLVRDAVKAAKEGMVGWHRDAVPSNRARRSRSRS